MSEPWTLSAAGEVTERWEFLTNALSAATGPEQRRQLRAAPRIAQQFDSQESEARRRRMEHALLANGGSWDVPLVQDTVALPGPLSAGADTLPVSTVGRRFVAGGRVLVFNHDDTQYEVRTVNTVASGGITLTAGLSNAWSTGVVIPLFRSKLIVAPTLERFTGAAAFARLEFQLVDAVDWPADSGSATYRGLPVLEMRPNWSTAPQVTPERGFSTVDYDIAPPVLYEPAGVPLSLQRLGFTAVGRDEISELFSLLYALAGRCSPVWVPSHALDLIPVASLTSAGTTLDIESVGLSAWPIKANRRDLRIQLVTGEILYRRITDADALTADTERLTLDSAFDVDADASEVEQISFMAHCRQDTDVNLLRWWRDDVVLTELTFRAIPDEL